MTPAVTTLLASLAALGLAACGQTSADSAAAPAGASATADSALGTAHRGAPQRRSGWWLFTAVTDTGASMGTQNLCVTEATEARFSAFDQITQEQLLGYHCSTADFHRAGNGWDFDVACDTGIAASEGGGVVTSKGSISGDLHSAYEIRMTVAQAGETHKGTIKAAHQGSCPAGRQPGDLVIDGSQTVNVLTP